MKAYILTTMAVLFAWPVAAFEKHELDLGPGIYNPATGMTVYKVNGPEICFAGFPEHKAYADAKGLEARKVAPIGQGSWGVVLGNADDTYSEMYLVKGGVGCLKAVAYAEGAPA